MKRLLATLEIFRPHNMIVAAGCVLCGYYLSGGSAWREIALPLIFTGLVTGLGNLINDYFDADIDRVNKPRRPIPSGRLSPAYVHRLYWTGTVVVTLLMIRWLPTNLLGLMLAWEGLLYSYARKSKRMGIVGNFLISSIAGSAFVGGAMLTGNYHDVVFPALLAFLLVMGRELLKGAEDVEGDKRAGASTVAVRFGVERAVRCSALVLFLCVLAAPIPGLARLYGRAYALFAQLLFVPGILLATYISLTSTRRPALSRASGILKIQMFVGLLAMSLGRT